MTVLVWDELGSRLYETGVDHGVLYIPDSDGSYVNGVAWNGLTSVSESPSGAEPTATYADNIKYLNLISVEEFGGTIEAYTYPDEFGQFDGLKTPTPGVFVGQQGRRGFGLSYRTQIGNDLDGDSHGYKLHLIYGCYASPSEKQYTSINDSPEAINFSWAFTTTPVIVDGMRPTAVIVIDSTKVDATILAAFEQMLYGDTGVDPVLPLPEVIIEMFSEGITEVTPTQPTFNSGTNTITIPSITGVNYYIDNVLVLPGPVVITEDTIVTARPDAGYLFISGVDDDWFYNFT